MSFQSYKDIKLTNPKLKICPKCEEVSVSPPAGDKEERYAAVSSGEDSLLFRPHVWIEKNIGHLTIVICRRTIKLCDIPGIEKVVE